MKGQGLPTSTIILIILALVILVFVIVFVIIPITRNAIPPPPSTTMSSFSFNCATNYCGKPTSSNNVPANTYFCTKTVVISKVTYHCYDSYGGSRIANCSYTSQNGTQWSDIGSIQCG